MNLFCRLLPEWRQRYARVRTCFRDPAKDFGITVTTEDALAGPQLRRRSIQSYVVEHGVYLSLFPGDGAASGVHAVMNRTAPNDLVLSYTQIMAGFKHFIEAPRTICMLGLGGGSLAKFCFQRFPESRILAVEICPEIIAMRRLFQVPEDDARFCVLQMDGILLVAQQRDAFDVLILDVFNENGHPPQFATPHFYRACYRALKSGGVLVTNMSGEGWKKWFRKLDQVFGRQTVLYECPDGDNVIVFATKGSLPPWVQ